MRTPITLTIAAISMGLGLGACGVSMSTHRAVVAELQQTRAQLRECQSASARMRLEHENLATQLNSTQSSEEQCLSELSRAQTQLDAVTRENEARQAIYDQMMGQLRAMVDAGQLDVRIDHDRIVLAMPNDVLFASGSAQLSPEGRQSVIRVAGVLAGIHDRRFQVEGHTDDVPIRSGNYRNNWELSTARALSVVDLLMASGVSPENLSAAGYGQWAPRASNETADGRAENRRIEIVVLPDLDMLPLVSPAATS
jgi:chemotaxis protein MotB